MPLKSIYPIDAIVLNLSISAFVKSEQPKEKIVNKKINVTSFL